MNLLSLLLAAPLISATVETGPKAAQQDPPAKKEVVEKRTKIAFPITLTVPADTGPTETGKVKREAVELALAGIGVRDKYFLNVKVYAFGFYVQPAPARKALSKWIGKSAKEMSKDKGFSQAACSNEFIKSFRLVFYRDVDGEDVAEAFDDSLQPRIKKAQKSMKMADATKELAVFRSIFDEGEIEEGDEILFHLFPDGRIDTYLRGKAAPRIQSPALSWALQDVYLGMDSIEDNEEKAKMISRLPDGVLKPTK